MVHIPTDKYGEDYCDCECGCDLLLVGLEVEVCTYCINNDHLEDMTGRRSSKV